MVSWSHVAGFTVIENIPMIKINGVPVIGVMTVDARTRPVSFGGEVTRNTIRVSGVIEINILPIIGVVARRALTEVMAG